jgi:PRTRC genetic system protein A
MFKIVVADGTQEMPKDDIYYVVGKEGIFIKKRLGIMESLSPVKTISILESVQATAKMHIPEIPAILTAKVANFFREVQKEHRSEAIVLLFFNEQTQKYKVVPPAQKVGPASLDYNRSIVIDGWTMIGDIHSHSSMSAFHSGTDQGDEESFDGLHITFGNLNSELISISASIVSNGHRTIVSPDEYLKGIRLDHEIDEVEKIPTSRVYKWENGKMIETTKYAATTFRSYRKYDRRYIITSEKSVKAQCPKAWMDTVEYQPTYSYSNPWAGYGGWRGNYQAGHWESGKWIAPKYNNNWGKNFDPDTWKNRQTSGYLEQKDTKAPIQNVGVKVDPIKFPAHDQGPIVTEVTPSRYMPCKTCAFKEKAVEYVADLLVDQNNGTIEEKSILDDDKESYVCEKCNVLVTFDYDEEDEIKGDMVCPSCKSDEHMTLIEENDFTVDDDKSGTVPIEPGQVKCVNCFSTFDVSFLETGKDGGSCQFCGTLLMPDQSLNYEKNGEHYNCKSCGSQFTKELIKDNNCPFCKIALVEYSGAKNRDLLGDANEVEQVAIEEAANYQAAEEPPNPANMIAGRDPHPMDEMIRSNMNPLQWMMEKFGRKR